MSKKKPLKPVLPTMRERKRYMVFEMISEKPITSAKDVFKAINASLNKHLGTIGCAKAGVLFPKDTYYPDKQKGILKVAHTETEPVRFSLMQIQTINDTKVIFKTVGISGILKKAKRFL
jgi:ribonuclease P/MRP protein subunit POP5